MKRPFILVLYSLPLPCFPDGTPDPIGRKSSLDRLQGVATALRASGYRLQALEFKDDWAAVLEKISKFRMDLVFNLCEEFRGHSKLEMNIAALLEMIETPFTGSSSLALGLSQDKGKTKSLLANHGIPTPAYVVYGPGDRKFSPALRYPLIAKPAYEDGSLGIDNDAFVADEKVLRRKVKSIHRSYRQPALVEEYIGGRELNVSIIGNEKAEVLPISEIDFSGLPAGLPKICSYAAKWVEGSKEFAHTQPLCPADLKPDIRKRVKAVALQSYRILDCRDYARVDIRLSARGVPYVLEINANPDISLDAGMVRSAMAAGYSYKSFISRIVEVALARSRRQSSGHR
jgi:D-alanine-D-alanine ligase